MRQVGRYAFCCDLVVCTIPLLFYVLRLVVDVNDFRLVAPYIRFSCGRYGRTLFVSSFAAFVFFAVQILARRRVQRTVCFAVDRTERLVRFFDDNKSDLIVDGVDRVTHTPQRQSARRLGG